MKGTRRAVSVIKPPKTRQRWRGCHLPRRPRGVDGVAGGAHVGLQAPVAGRAAAAERGHRVGRDGRLGRGHRHDVLPRPRRVDGLVAILLGISVADAIVSGRCIISSVKAVLYQLNVQATYQIQKAHHLLRR